jgi:nucleoside-diphosphate-sugar epimerase
MHKILLTGWTGFIGAELLKQLKLKKYFIHTSSRSALESKIDKVKHFRINQIDNNLSWSDALEGVDCIIHCAGITSEANKADINDFRKINVEGAHNLAYQAATKGVKRLIFLSSIKVNGERTEEFLSFKNTDIPNPVGTYAMSKWEAEKSLHTISKQTGLEIVIIRAPMVYGRGVKGNFLRLLNLVDRGFPLPFGKVNNLRSFVSLDNLVDLIISCINHPKAAGKTFLVSDGEDLSTPSLVKRIANIMKKNSYLIPAPISLINFTSKIIGKSKEIDRLVYSLQIDNSFTIQTLDWKPITTVEEGLFKTIQWYLKKN